MKLRDSPGACWLSVDRRRSLLIVSASFLIGGDAMAQTQSEASSARKVSYLVVYRPGPAWPPGKPVSELPLREHWQYMVSLFGKGTMTPPSRRASSFISCTHGVWFHGRNT
jgi:hypothetical protein